MRTKRATPRRREAPQEDRSWWEWADNLLITRCNLRCEHCGADLNLTGIERHHRVRRRDGGDTLANLLVLCPLSHRYITEHPTEAYANGWSVRALATQDPGEVPVRIDGRLWLLRDDGTRRLIP